MDWQYWICNLLIVGIGFCLGRVTRILEAEWRKRRNNGNK
jgi:hypothetical protein